VIARGALILRKGKIKTHSASTATTQAAMIAILRLRGVGGVGEAENIGAYSSWCPASFSPQSGQWAYFERLPQTRHSRMTSFAPKPQPGQKASPCVFLQDSHFTLDSEAPQLGQFPSFFL